MGWEDEEGTSAHYCIMCIGNHFYFLLSAPHRFSSSSSFFIHSLSCSLTGLPHEGAGGGRRNCNSSTCIILQSWSPKRMWSEAGATTGTANTDSLLQQGTAIPVPADQLVRKRNGCYTHPLMLRTGKDEREVDKQLPGRIRMQVAWFSQGDPRDGTDL